MGFIRDIHRRMAISNLAECSRITHKEEFKHLLSLMTNNRIKDTTRTTGISLDTHILVSDEPTVAAYKKLASSFKHFIAQHSPDSLGELRRTVEIVRSMQDKYPQNEHPDAHENAPELALELTNTFLSMFTPLITNAQKRSLTAATFTTYVIPRLQNDTHYFPSFRYPHSSESTIHHYITDRILAAPDSDPLEHAEAYAARMKRQVAVSDLMQQSMTNCDSVCNFSDEALELVAELRPEQDQYFWTQIKELSQREDVTSESLISTLRLGRNHLEDFPLGPMHDIIQHFDVYPEFNGSPMGEEGSLDWQRREAIMHLTLMFMYGSKDYTSDHVDNFKLTDHRVVNRIMDNPETGEAMVDLIEDRRTFTYEQFEESLTAGALGDGAL